jgi:hypothetical protein
MGKRRADHSRPTGEAAIARLYLALTLLLALLAALAVQVGRRSPSNGGKRPSPGQGRDGSGVEGVVSDANGPLAEVLVRWKGTDVSAVTGHHGGYRLPGGRGRRVTAWKGGYFIAGRRADDDSLDLRLKPLPPEDQEEYEWVDPAPDPAATGNCGNCHLEIYREWVAGGHSRSATGRHFRNLYEGTDWNGKNGVGWGLLTDHPDGAAVCASCHAPAIPAGDPALLDLRELKGVALRGVHCDYCHKVRGLADGTVGLTHGRFNLRLLRPRPDHGQIFFGPLDDVDRGEDAYAPLYRDSRYCASCHEGVVFGVHVYGTYSEWQQSPARREGRQCQDCHMKPTGRMTNLAPGHGGIERDPGTLADHRLFDGSQADMLRRCVRVSADARRVNGRVRAEVRVGAEGVGHRVPTGFIDRHLLLIVEGIGAGGEEIAAESGPRLPPVAGARLAGRPGRLYARLLKDLDGHSPAPFWKADLEPVDTRLTPGEIDASRYVFPAEVGKVRVRVVYRRFWEEVARVKKWPERDLVVFERTFEVAQ